MAQTARIEHSLYGPLADPAADAGHLDHPPRMGFFTDTSVCIGCKACEVACKEWNDVPEDGIDLLGHVLRQHRHARRELLAARRLRRAGAPAGPAGRGPVDLPTGPSGTGAADATVADALPAVRPRRRRPGHRPGAPGVPHLRTARGRHRSGEPHLVALADVLRRVQALHARRVPGRLPHRGAVPHRVRLGGGAGGHLQRLRLLRLRLPLRRDRPAAGRRPGLEVHPVLRPAARRPGTGLRQACPTESIQFGPLDELRERAAGARGRSCTRRASPRPGCTAHDPEDGVGGDGAFFLLLDDPEVYGLPPDPVVPTRDLPAMWRYAAWPPGAAGRPRRPAGGPATRRRGSAAVGGGGSEAAVAMPRRGERGRATGRRRRGSVVRAGEFRSYYGRPVLKPPVWEWTIPAYFFTGGLSAGAALLAAGADLTGRPALRRAGRLGGFAALGVSTYLLIEDLGRPERFHHMLRVAKPTSPMSVGTWILAAYGPGSALAAGAELLPAALRATRAGRVLWWAARPAGLFAALFAPARGLLHGRTALPDGRPGLARRAPGTAVRLHRVGGGQRRRPRHAAGAGVRGGSRPRARGGRGGGRTPGVAADRAAARPGAHGLHHRAGASAAPGRRRSSRWAGRSRRCRWRGAAAGPRRPPGWPCSPAASCSGSASSRRAWRRRRTRPMSWCRSANG